MLRSKKRQLLRVATGFSALCVVALLLALGFQHTIGARASSAATLAPGQVTVDALKDAHGQFSVVAPHDHLNGQGHARFGISDIDSIPNFNGHYFADGYDPNGNPIREWYYNTVGNPPQLGGTTNINAPIVPVALSLLDANGNQLYYDDPTQDVQPTVNSPVFQNSTYSSSATPTQFTDAVQRAEYAGKAKADWHTELVPNVKTTRVMQLPAGSYHYALNSDGTCCLFVLVNINTFGNLLFPATDTDTTTPVGAAEHAGDITTKDISTFLFPNTFLYFDSGACCVLGYHTYDVEPGDASNGNLQRDYVLNYSSWITPGLFGAGFQDVTATSHEMAETFNDPFVTSDGVHNVTPWWLAPNGNCQDNLETGDVIEGLPNAVYPVTMNGFTYHPQNEALLQWFEMQSPSDALDGAYSYPDESVLTAPSAPQKAGCA